MPISDHPGLALPLFAGVVGYQVAGWVWGPRVFSSVNGEAMMFVFATGGLAFFWWVLEKMQLSQSTAHLYMGRAACLGLSIVGAVFGVLFKIRTG